jgi:hypothetical protein
MRILGISVLGLLELTACSHGTDEARHTVDEYRADPALRHAEVKRCRRDPGTLRGTADCVNAETAASFEDRVRLRDAPPVGLEREPAPLDPRNEE